MKYPYIKILPEWITYAEQSKARAAAKKQRYSVLLAIIEYGAVCREPEGLPEDELEWFNRVVRPEIDRQHKRMEEGRKL
jgi:hypothetical protein